MTKDQSSSIFDGDVRDTMRGIIENYRHLLIIEHIHDRPYTFVRLKLKDSRLQGLGFAKCNPNDEWSSYLGFEIAMGRALKKLANQMRIAVRGAERFVSAELRAEWSESLTERDDPLSSSEEV